MFSSLVVVSLFSLLIGVESDSRLKCTQSVKLDLQLIIDSSGSIGKTNFRLMMQEIADDLIGQFDIGKDKTRVSLFKYSSSDVMKEEFDLDTYTDAASLKKAIKAVKYEHGYTKTGEAMEKALAHYSAKMRKEKETAKACIVFTDGEANDAAKIPAALKAWEKKGVTVFALGIGKRIKDAGLVAITGSKDRFIKVPDFKAIAKAANSLLVKVCKAIPTKPDVINGYQYVENVGLRVLKVHPEKKPWAAAQSVCRAEGGELVKVDSKEMNDWLAKQTLNNVWIGATDNGHEGKWTTPDGSPASNSFWYSGEPNNCCGGQNCAVVNFWTGVIGGKGTWDDQGCGVANSFVCQIMVSLKVHHPGYQYVGNGLSVLKVHPEKKPWAAAQSVCHAEGGELVIVDSKAMNDWLAKQTYNIWIWDNIWIGATDEGHEGKWTTPDGNPASNSFWSKGEPNNCCGGQNCAVINFRNGAWGGKGTWDDQGCGVANSFVCQIMVSLKVHNPGYRLCLMKVHPEKKPWAAAQSICHAEGGELVKVDSKATNDWLARQTLDNIWIGATDNGHEGRWTYLDGSPTVNNFWSKGEPNNCCGGQNCAVVNFRNGALGLGGKGTWDDQGCGLANSFVCQIML